MYRITMIVNQQRISFLLVIFSTASVSYSSQASSRNMSSSSASSSLGSLSSSSSSSSMVQAKASLEFEALCRLAQNYQTGAGVTKDEKLAFELYEIAAQRDYAPAEYELGRCYEYGKGVDANQFIALNFYKAAGKKGYARAQTKLGDFHMFGKAMWFFHPDQAVEWYTKAALQGEKDALYSLGECYESGSEFTANQAKAFVYYQLAAQRGNEEAKKKVAVATEEMKKYISLDTQDLRQLADALSVGENSVRDIEMAKKLYQVAAKRGNSEANKKVEALSAEIKVAEDCRKKEAKDNAQASAASEQPAATHAIAVHQQRSISSSASSSSQDTQSASSVQNDEQNTQVELLSSHASGDSSSSQQDVKARAAQETNPIAHTESLTKELRASLLKDCPTGIRTLLDLWGQYNVAWKSKDEQRCKKLHAILPRKLLLVGPSGARKSMMSKAIAEECGMSFLMYFATSFSSQGESSGIQGLEKFFRDAASLRKPCVVIIDELQELFKQHASKNDTDSSFLILLLTLLDRYKDSPILVIATSDHLSEVQIIDRFSFDTVEIFS